ncbi:type IV pilin protein [Dentiradicibacter hellwigii]|uniref:Type IV pilin protein n=1 Tax=Dentiradicibacter hellwigii TaxID=3149053 RepID=A0ABV4UGA9_9RHOO
MKISETMRAYISRLPARRRVSAGFTLLELMVVMLIIAILAAIAYPSYQESVRKGRRAEARAALAELIQQQERYMTQNNTYLAFSGGATGVPFKTFVGNSLGEATYTLSVEACTGRTIRECVLATATPTSRFKDPRVGSLSLTSTGVKTCTDSGGADIASGSADFKVCWP